MKDIKRCFICENNFSKKDRGMCSVCINKAARFRSNVRGSIYSSFKYGIKSYIWKFLPYTVSDLKVHLESHFEPWMMWNNQGIYNSHTWDDNNFLTWTWNIDHIIPQANFIFFSVLDQNFIDCWSLDNLKPISAKLNVRKNIKERHETKRMG